MANDPFARDCFFPFTLQSDILIDPRAPLGGGGPGDFVSTCPVGASQDLFMADLGLHPLAPMNTGFDFFAGRLPSDLRLTDTSAQKKAPWMAYAIAEAKRHKGITEGEIAKIINYHQETGATFLKEMSGTQNAWCASFVNWCLQSAGLTKWKNSFRARAVAEDANFTEIKSPVYGAITLVGTHHACFFYAHEKKSSKPICLGGNQSDQINFTVFKEKVRYFVPTPYLETAKKEIAEEKQLVSTAEELNTEFGIKTDAKKPASTR